jgi:hypothetical protein
MLQLSPVVRRVLWGTAIAFVLLVALRVHGFSLPIWHGLIDDSPRSEILLGEAQFIRGDDWALQLPLALAQAAHDPAFPVVNENIGAGQNMLVPLPLPVAHPVSLFRPTLWGYFIGKDTGLAWMWWSQVLGLFAVWLLVFLVVTSNRFGLSCGGSLLLVCSPFFQFFSFNAAPVTTYVGLCFLATVGLATTRRPRAMLGWGLLLGWSGACFVLTLYPPYVVLLAYLFLFLTVGFFWESWRALDLRAHLAARVLGLGIALLIAAGGALAYLVDAREVIEVMRQTEYPGSRFETGGDEPWYHLVTANLWTSLRILNYRPLGNICGSSAFWFLFPVIGATVIWWLAARRERADRMLVAFALFCAAILWYRHLGFPESLARASLFSTVLPKRTILALGLADVLLLLRFLSLTERVVGRGAAAALAVLGASLLALGAYALHGVVPELIAAASVALVALNGVVAFLVLRRWRPVAVVGAMAAGSAVCTLWFNPLVVGGTDYLTGNPLSTEIREIDEEHGGESVWVTYGSPRIANLFRILGVRALDGTHVSPHFDLWKILDPSGSMRPVYNRYAKVQFRLPRGDKPALSVLPPWGLFVDLDPRGVELPAMGVTHVLVGSEGSPRERRYWSRFEPVGQTADHHIFELPLRPRRR